MTYKFTKHAMEAAESRATFLGADADSIVRLAVPVVHVSQTEEYRLYWSPANNEGYVLVLNPKEQIVITVIRAVRQQDGKGAVIRSFARGKGEWRIDAPGKSSWRIGESHIKHAMLLVGVEPPAEIGLTPEPGLQRSSNFYWSARCISDGGPKTRRLGKAVSAPADGGPPPAEVIASAREFLAKVSGWKGVLSLIDRDTSAPSLEWELEDL